MYLESARQTLQRGLAFGQLSQSNTRCESAIRISGEKDTLKVLAKRKHSKEYREFARSIRISFVCSMCMVLDASLDNSVLQRFLQPEIHLILLVVEEPNDLLPITAYR